MANTTKSASEIVAAARIALEKAEAKHAREIAKSDPTVSELTDALDSINADININSRLLNGPNSFENRLKATQLRAEWIDAQMSLTIAQDELLRAQKISLQAHIDNLAERVANDEENLPSASEVLDSLPQPTFAQLIDDEHKAKNAWKESTPAAITARMKAEKFAPIPENTNEASA